MRKLIKKGKKRIKIRKNQKTKRKKVKKTNTKEK
jgi:hypothetical protein